MHDNNNNYFEAFKLYGDIMLLFLVGIYVTVLTCHGAIKSNEAASISNSFANPISLESVLSGQYLAKHMNATWMSDNELIYRDEDVSVEFGYFLVFYFHFRKCLRFFQMNVLKFDVDTNEVIVLANASQIPILKSSFSADISPDFQYLLFGRDHRMVFRHTTLARYSILDLESKNVIELSPVS